MYCPVINKENFYIDYIPSNERILCCCNNRTYTSKISILNHFNTVKHRQMITEFNKHNLYNMMDIDKHYVYYEPCFIDNTYCDVLPDFNYVSGILCQCCNNNYVYKNQESFLNHLKSKYHCNWIASLY